MAGAESNSDWDDYFIGIANAVAGKSKDPNCKVGAIIVSPDKLVVATGFNGLARTLGDDTELLQSKIEKLDWMVHAEHNAVLNAARAGARTQGSTIYVNKFPCFACLQVLVQAGISGFYTEDREYWKNDPCDSDHSGKRYIISRSSLQVRAPNHPDFSDRLPLLKGTPRKTGQSEPPGAARDPANTNDGDATATNRGQ